MANLKQFERRCYESAHMHPREWGLLHVLQRVTKGGKSTLFFDGRAIAKWFTGVSKTSIYDSAARLVRDGWLIPINGEGKRRAAGSKKFEATMYQVLTHEQWIRTENGKGKCNPVRNEGLESSPEVGNGPVRNEGMGQSGNLKKPVRNEGRNYVIACSVKESSVKECYVGPPQDFLETQGTAEQVGVATLSMAASPEVGTGPHAIPDCLEYDGSKWGARQGIGRALSSDELDTMKLLNWRKVKP